MFKLKEWWKFITKPAYVENPVPSANFFRISLKIFIVSILIMGTLNFLTKIIIPIFLTLPDNNALEFGNLEKYPVYYYFITLAIFSPIIEEIIFRLSLVFKPIYLSLSVSSLTSLILYKTINHYLALIVFIVLFFLIKYLAGFNYDYLFRIWRKYFKSIFYFIAISFGLIHITNYTFNNPAQLIIVPFLILPQIVLGLLLSYARVYFKKGFIMSLFVHILLNSISLTVNYISNYS